LVDEHGTSVPFQFEQYSENMSRALDLVFVAQQVPSVGYKTYYLVPTAKPDTFPPATNVNLDNENDIKNPRRIVGSDVLENDFYRATIDRATGLTDVFDKELNRDVLKNAQISASEERGGNSLSIEPPCNRRLPNRIPREGCGRQELKRISRQKCLILG
jgi:alpha-mannosidase